MTDFTAILIPGSTMQCDSNYIILEKILIADWHYYLHVHVHVYAILCA